MRIRYTAKKENSYYYVVNTKTIYNAFPKSKTKREIVNEGWRKLGIIEDIEEKHNIDVEVLVELLTEGIWYKTNKKRLRGYYTFAQPSSISLNPNEEGDIEIGISNSIGKCCYITLKDFGVLWLTKKEFIRRYKNESIEDNKDD